MLLFSISSLVLVETSSLTTAAGEKRRRGGGWGGNGEASEKGIKDESTSLFGDKMVAIWHAAPMFQVPFRNFNSELPFPSSPVPLAVAALPPHPSSGQLGHNQWMGELRLKHNAGQFSDCWVRPWLVMPAGGCRMTSGMDLG